MPNPKAEIDFNELDAMLQFGPSQRFCCEHFKISMPTLNKLVKEHSGGLTFAEYKDKKMDKTRLKLQQTAIQMAIKKDRVMLIFCLKNLCKWADKIENDHDINMKSTILIAPDESDL